MGDQDEMAELRLAYEQLCNTYRAIDDFRTKLLGFLPLVTGGVFVLLTNNAAKLDERFLTPVGAFGIAVTSGLLAYELFGIRKCHALLATGTELERLLRLPAYVRDKPAGQFGQRPNNLLGIVNEPFAAAAIYPAVLAAWTYVAIHQRNGMAPSIAVFVTGFLGILLYDAWLRGPGKHDGTGHRRIPGVTAFTRWRSSVRRSSRPAPR